MIDVACALGWISTDAKKFGHALRDYRNFIHPRELMKASKPPDARTVNICAEVVEKALHELSEAGMLQ